MQSVYLLRHWPTAWNQQGLIQGRCDIPLTKASMAALKTLQVPPNLQISHWYVSPLQRAKQTLANLGLTGEIAESLTEMDWGEWEGKSLAELRQTDPRLTIEEPKGIHLQCPKGESPKNVQQRLLGWLQQFSDKGEPIGIVTHKGVIRTALAAACQWDMTTKPPVKLNWQCIHHFHWDGRQLHLMEANIPLCKQG
ncbi:phosphoglycerate mutase family protein [Endozoicomonas sp. SM1973]|uniref:Phosphoglycerate mutase family protein n=1 Tax=Spartinivicinus marinus TaxID=2994442 RepID=A0A853I4C7_9GAMM|nr:histidine phosphatase family protein [Spartinivicinus marinus]MCX4029821.1 histidine phosphatase family protein [Spartinivicinus marinus]NYZ67509.1 phosphoglycerate mutase family protein [Spartinivicinus marinus]